MSKNFHFDLGNMPPAGWLVLIMIIAMGAGRLFEVSWLFKLGAFGLGAVVVMLLIALAKEFID